MELVYLWVDHYKNIDKQGFNFSPRFDCKFFPEYEKVIESGVEIEKFKKNCLLKITPKDHIMNFFGNNIDVMAIVGENGSGKSTIIELISKLILNIEIEANICFLIKHEEKIICFTNIEQLDLKGFLSIQESIEHIERYDLFSVFYSSNFTNGHLNSILELFTTPFFRTHHHSDFDHTHGHKNDYLKVQSLLNLVFNSVRTIDYHPSSSATRNQHAFTINEQYENFEISKIIFILHFLKLFGKNYLPLKIQNNDQVIIGIQHNKYTVTKHTRVFIEKVEALLELDIQSYRSEDENARYLANVKHDEYEAAKQLFLDFLRPKVDQLQDYNHFSLNIEESLEFIDLYLDLYRFNRNLIDSLFDFRFKNLSSGEESLILMFALLERGISSFIDHKITGREYNFLLMLNEMETELHPQWQKQLFLKLLKFLNIISNHWKKEYNKKINFSVLLVSHSPFILSDLPNENVIFLKDGRQIHPNINTFGANIHTLLSHGFFMRDGLMGDFAKERINRAITYLNQKQLSEKAIEYCENIISIIGEPILKRQLQKMLDSKRLSEVDQIKQRIKELQEELAKKEDKK